MSSFACTVAPPACMASRCPIRAHARIAPPALAVTRSTLYAGVRVSSRPRRSTAVASRRACVAPMAAQKQQFSSFADMIEGSDVPVLVDFYATWCGPCQLLSPVLQEVGASLRGRIKVVKIDTDKYPAIATEYNIAALPTVVLFKDGQVVEKMEGMMTAQQLIPKLEYYLN